MAQRIVEILIGRLITDERLRAAFLANPEATLRELCESGLDLSRTEKAALANTDPALWSHAAELLDARLQKASLESNPHSQEEREHV